MAPTNILPLVDRLIPGGAEPFLREARGKGQSFRRIAKRLAAEHNITVAAQTVANWCAQLDIEKGEAA